MRLKLKPTHKRYLLIILAILIVAVGGAITRAMLLGGSSSLSSSSDIDLQKGLVGWWKLDGNAKDSTPYGNDGTLVGGPTGSTDRHGISNSAMSFNGTSQYITFPASGLPTSAITVSLWVNQSTLVNYYDLAANNWTTEGSWDLYTLGNGGVLFGVFSSGLQYNSSCNASSLTTNSWHHIVGTYDGTTVKTYFDGSLCPTTKAISGVVLRNSGSWTLGEHAAGSSSHSIDDLRIYSRALTAGEVGTLYNVYNSSLSVASGENSLVGWWKLDGDVKDATPYSDDGTATGAAAVADREGRSTSAYSLDGVSNYIEAPTPSKENTGSFTATFWFTLNSTVNCDANNNWRSLIRQSSSTSGATAGWDVVLEESPGVQFDLGLNGTDSRSGTVNVGLAVGTPVYLTFTYDASSGTRYIYANSVQKETKTDTPGVGVSPSALLDIGKGANAVACPNGSGYTPGTYDDVRLYSRALSQGEVNNLYSSYDSSVSLYSSPGSASSVNLSSGLVGEWDMNGNARDATPYGNNGTVSGATLTTDRNGRASSAYQLGNTNQWIGVGSPGTYSALPSAFTYSIWLESTGTSSTQWPEIMGASNTHTYFGIRTNNFGGSVYFEYGTSPFAGTTFAGTTSYPLGTNTWHMYTVTFDGSTLKTYLDGVFKSQATSVSLDPAFGGLNFSTSSSGFVGAVDDGRAWNRALSSTEVTALYSIYR